VYIIYFAKANNDVQYLHQFRPQQSGTNALNLADNTAYASGLHSLEENTSAEQTGKARENEGTSINKQTNEDRNTQCMINT
jgi:hypothetical protein